MYCLLLTLSDSIDIQMLEPNSQSSVSFSIFWGVRVGLMWSLPDMHWLVLFMWWPWSDSNIDKRSWNEKLGKCDFTLAFILLLNIQNSAEDTSHQSFRHLPDPSSIISSVRDFTSWIMWGSTGEESSAFFSHSIELALFLFRHGQCDAVQVCYGLIFLKIDCILCKEVKLWDSYIQSLR